MNYTHEYETWLAFPGLIPEYRAELEGIPDSEIKERFYAPLSFGTAGLRGIMGAGISRMNDYTVARATRGLAAALLSSDGKSAERGVVITYDCRINSEHFARLAAGILSSCGIKVLITDGMRPTPLLSATIIRLGAAAGINITASHNPKEYNGYKVYWDDGAQISGETAALVSSCIEKEDIFRSAEFTPDPSKIHLLGAENDEAFLACALSQRINAGTAGRSGLKIVYTPFHGTGAAFIPEALSRCGFKNVFCVEAQMIPDGSFPTVKSPNPENVEGFALATELARSVGADVIIGSDPDADRIGVLSPDGDGGYLPITGNQVGLLLSDYILSSRRDAGTLPEKPAIVSSIVSTQMTRAICASNCAVYGEAFTGFRFIAEEMTRLEAGGCTCLMGFEESYGYLIGSHCRDKDAVTAAVMIAEMASVCKERGLTLSKALDALYKKYGYFAEKTINLVMPGVDGIAARRSVMEKLRLKPPSVLGGIDVCSVRDYSVGTRRTVDRLEKMRLSGSDVLIFGLSDGSSFAVRPSGTEPKIKIYLLVTGGSSAECAEKIDALSLSAEGIKA